MDEHQAGTSKYTKLLQSCRICTKTSNAMVGLFGTQKNGVFLSEMIYQCTQLTMHQNDNRPPSICNECVENLNVAYEFCNLAKSSEQKFQELISSHEWEPSKSNLFERFSIDDESNNDFSMFVEDLKMEIKEEISDVNETGHVEIIGKRPILPRNRTTNKAKAEHVNEQVFRVKSKENLRLMKSLFECYKCRDSFNLLKDMRTHIKQHTIATPHQCPICLMHFSTRLFKRHLCRGKSIQCENCPKSFNTTVKLLDHFNKDEHPKKVYKCNDCSKFFPMKFLCEIHTAEHKTVKKTHICQICSRAFRDRAALKSHISSHSESRPHLCSQCGQGFVVNRERK